MLVHKPTKYISHIFTFAAIMNTQKNNPLHGITLEMILNHLVKNYEWQYLATEININCFKSNPSVKSSLTFLRKKRWARTKVENLYMYLLRQEAKDIKQIFKDTSGS